MSDATKTHHVSRCTLCIFVPWQGGWLVHEEGEEHAPAGAHPVPTRRHDRNTPLLHLILSALCESQNVFIVLIGDDTSTAQLPV